VIVTWGAMARQYMRTMFVSHGNFIVASVMPVILCAPKYLSGDMTLGTVMQAAAAFIQVQYAFNWIVDNYPRLAEWTASARRASNLLVAIDALEHVENSQTGAIKRGEGGEGAAIRLKDVSVALSDGTVVVDDADVTVNFGERVLVAGESGTGKSTLVRAIAGLWPWGGGSIEVEQGAKLMLLPQRPYVPIGTLRRAATYPDPAESRSVEEVAQAFRRVGLDHLIERMDEDAPWDQTLSGGEKQRLAFARIFLHKPDIIVLDEATAALDPNSQDELMAHLSERPEETTLVSVGHRPELEAFHSRKITLERRRGGAKLVGDIKLVRRPGRARLLRRMLRRGRARKREAKASA
jgi:putative ATP-binding cassette transporter